MRKILLSMVLLGVLSAASAFAFDPAELNRITFVNTTGAQIQTIFLSPGDSMYWGPDIIGADFVLKDGGSIGYYVHYPQSSFDFDVLATDDQGREFVMRGLKMVDGKEQTITLTRKGLDTAATEFTLATVEVENDTGAEIQYLFISPADSDAWGADLLDEENTLADGDSHAIVIPVGKEKAPYNLFAEDGDGKSYFFNVTIDPSKGKEFAVSIEKGDMQAPGGE
ncbi:MAG: hypothetical protein ABSG63_10720 [Spirochaetia bacterium]